MPAHHYRITIDRVDRFDALNPDGEGLESLSFFVSAENDLFVEANQLRHRLDCSSCQATRLAVGRCLLAEESAVPDLVRP